MGPSADDASLPRLAELAMEGRPFLISPNDSEGFDGAEVVVVDTGVRQRLLAKKHHGDSSVYDLAMPLGTFEQSIGELLHAIRG